ncbi:MAG: extracellular solute-binding protein, partial [Acidimicrobiia bacterium]
MAFLLAVLAVAGSCSALGAEEKNVVRVYSGRHYGSEKAFELFGQETGIDVEFLFGSDGDLRERLKTEGEDTLADVYLTVDASNLALAASSDLLRPLESKTLTDTVPAQYRDPQNRWFALALRTRSIIYNPEKVDPAELSTYAALADPKWKGRLCLRNSTATYTQ